MRWNMVTKVARGLLELSRERGNGSCSGGLRGHWQDAVVTQGRGHRTTRMQQQSGRWMPPGVASIFRSAHSTAAPPVVATRKYRGKLLLLGQKKMGARSLSVRFSSPRVSVSVALSRNRKMLLRRLQAAEPRVVWGRVCAPKASKGWGCQNRRKGTLVRRSKVV